MTENRETGHQREIFFISQPAFMENSKYSLSHNFTL